MTTMDEALELERKAQLAAEARIDDGWRRFQLEQDEPDVDAWDGWPGGVFCGCDTCTVREALDAAFPYLAKLADVMRELNLEMEEPA